MTFNFWSLDYLYYPVSGIMWVWHKVFGSFMGASNPWAWVLSIVFLVWTLRLLLFKPFMKQMDSQLKMQAIQPQMKKLREKYKDDRQRLTEEMMKLNKEAGVNPIGGCLPALIQAPVFIGLFHVLRMFQPVSNGQGGWTFRDNVYFFGKADVENFGLAKLFPHGPEGKGAPLSATMNMDAGQLAHMLGDRATVIWVGIPLTILAGIATHLTSRRSVNRQKELNPEAANSGQAAIMNKLMLWGFPVFVVIGGPFFPLAILFYWLANNSWTFGQLTVAHRLQDKRKATEEALVVEQKQASRFSRPTPGAKPTAGSKPVPGAKPAAGGKPTLSKNAAAGTASDQAPDPAADPSTGDGPAPGAVPAGSTAATASSAGPAKPGGQQRRPQPGARSAGGGKKNPNRNNARKKRKR